MRQIRARAFFLKIAASTLDAMIMIDSEGKVSFWNNAAESMFGYSANEAIGKPIYRLIIPSPMHEAHMNGFENFKKTGSGPVIGKLVEVEAMRKDGSIFPVELSLSAVKTKEGWNAVGVVRDISKRKALAERLRTKLDELERMNNLMVGRELKMEELRKEVRRLRATAGKNGKNPSAPKGVVVKTSMSKSVTGNGRPGRKGFRKEFAKANERKPNSMKPGGRCYTS